MSISSAEVYDVVIAGGGPGGATLAALLARETKLRVLVVEAERFPRDHIGESFVHPIIPNLERSGALAKVLASECWVKKYGGYYAWDPARPWATYFEHELHESDGFHRWAIHVDRAEFDQILLDHAAASGAEVREETPVTTVERVGDHTRVLLGEHGEVRCRVFVNATGRTSNTTISGEKAFLSTYRNIAIWGHVRDAKPAQSLDGDWNIFKDQDLSPIGNFAFDDGWVWYIPVPRIVDGVRVRTHSVGIVTDPAALKQPGKDFRDPATFMATVKEIPLLRELVRDAKLIGDTLHTATNYSRISGKMCDWDRKEIRIGDAAFFVDPLFSSGVNFTITHATAAALLIKMTFDEAIPEPIQRDLWSDYEASLHAGARAFAAGIDQWYHEISRDKPNSVYWRGRAGEATFDNRRETFHALVNGVLHSDLLQVITKGTQRTDELAVDGTLRRSLDTIVREVPPPTATVRLRSNLVVRESMTLEPGLPPPPPGASAPVGTTSSGSGGPPQGAAPPIKPFVHSFGPYWTDPIVHGDAVMHMFEMPLPCHRIGDPSNAELGEVKFVEMIHRGLGLPEQLAEPCNFGELVERSSPAQRNLLTNLALAGMLEVG